MKVRIQRKTVSAAGIGRFELVALDGGELPAFTAGAHIDVHLPSGLVRQYSISSAPTDRLRYELGILLEPNSRGGSIAAHAMCENDVIEIGEPRNHFGLAAHAEHSILIAGGIGITPMLSMAEALASQGASFELHYLLRDPQRHAFNDRLAATHIASSVTTYYDSEPAGACNLKALLSKPTTRTHVYVCGPAGLIETVIRIAAESGWADEQIHREFFAAPSLSCEPSGAFKLRLARSGRIVEVSADQTALDALLAAGIDIPTSCEQGVCGTCLTNVIEGEPDHRDSYLTDAERARNDQFLPCCSRSRSPMLTLDR